MPYQVVLAHRVQPDFTTSFMGVNGEINRPYGVSSSNQFEVPQKSGFFITWANLNAIRRGK